MDHITDQAKTLFCLYCFTNTHSSWRRVWWNPALPPSPEGLFSECVWPWPLGGCRGPAQALAGTRCCSLAWLKSQHRQVWAGRSGRKTRIPLCQGGKVSALPPEASLALALMRNSQGLPRLRDSCRQTKASAKESGNSKQSKGYYKENGNFNKVCKRRKASLCAGSVLHAYICQEKNFLDIKELWNTIQGRQLPNQFFIVSSRLLLQRK